MATTSPPFIYINGFPGVGKLTVAHELAKMIPNSKVYDNHKLIDATAAVYDRDMPEYRALRRQMRQCLLSSLAQRSSTRHITWIFTDSQSQNQVGFEALMDYTGASQKRGSLFLSVVLECELDENLRRLVAPGRGGENTKLTDGYTLRQLREKEKIFRFGGKLELVVDVTRKSPRDAAVEIKGWVDQVMSFGQATSPTAKSTTSTPATTPAAMPPPAPPTGFGNLKRRRGNGA